MEGGAGGGGLIMERTENPGKPDFAAPLDISLYDLISNFSVLIDNFWVFCNCGNFVPDPGNFLVAILGEPLAWEE